MNLANFRKIQYLRKNVQYKGETFQTADDTYGIIIKRDDKGKVIRGSIEIPILEKGNSLPFWVPLKKLQEIS